MSKVFDVGAEHRPFELRAEIVRLLGTADVRVFCVHRGGEGSAR
jgi:hypothetical protein